MALSRVGSGIWKMMSKQYQASVAACGPASLNQYGLKYDDVKIEQDADYAKALGRISDEEVQARARRMKRAFDISFKKKSLPADLQRLQAPLAPYATPLIDEAKARRVERELLNT
ncbi:ubiquinol-cytochrome C reductase complex 14kD subunit [Aureococcus anophagefferens]|nr:ubiquinol-cytochrome C reductase complex 14kD subunit [Aureococcus anophagefferens]